MRIILLKDEAIIIIILLGILWEMIGPRKV